MEINLLGMTQESKVVVALDFGTTYSGFAYALRTNPDDVYTFYDWPGQAEGGGLPYCKTKTMVLYVDASDDSDDPYELREWGWPAFVAYTSSPSTDASVAASAPASPDFDFEVVRDFDELPVLEDSEKSAARKRSNPTLSSGSGHFLVSLFKLHLAAKESSISNVETSVSAMPPGMTAKRAITDYLSEISKFILQEVRNKFGSHVTLDDVQWTLTVPSIWDEEAKREMRECCERAGLVQGPKSRGAGSPHPLKLFLEPEAASVYCQLKLKDHTWNRGDTFLVVDCGGGTVDLVLHEKLGSVPTLSVREVEESSGDLCGGSLVDDEFFSFMRRNVSCFERFEREYPTIVMKFRRTWEEIKRCFGVEKKDVRVELPPKLAEMWEMEQSMVSKSSKISVSSDEFVLTYDDMKLIFDPVVDRILELIEGRMSSNLKAIMVVGGFSESPYLMMRIRETFGVRVSAIVSPPFPGSAVCCGAVTMGIRSDTVVSRISKKTYGVRQSRLFIAGVHSEDFKVEGDSGQFYCCNVFGKFVRKGEEVRFDDCVTNIYFPISETQDQLKIDLYSSACENPKYVTELGSKKEGSFTIAIPTYEDLGFKPKVEVSMFFGRAEIQVTAIGKNFESEKSEMLPVRFERNGIY